MKPGADTRISARTFANGVTFIGVALFIVIAFERSPGHYPAGDGGVVQRQTVNIFVGNDGTAAPRGRQAASTEAASGRIDIIPLEEALSSVPSPLPMYNASWSANRSLLVHAAFAGRLGNVMFTYASLYGLARKNGRNALAVVGDKFRLYDYFELTIRRSTSDPRLPIRVGEGGRCCMANTALLHIGNDAHDVQLTGYLQSYRYFDTSWYDLIRREFKFKKAILDVCEQRVRAITAKAIADRRQNTTYAAIALNRTRLNGRERRLTDGDECVYVGVHARRGDFTKAGKRHFGHMPADEAYIQRAMDWFRLRYSSHACVRFLVLGDDAAWSRATLAHLSDVFVVDTHAEAIHDMCFLANLNATIATTGTYSWWAAALCAGTTTYQSVFARPGSAIIREYKREEHFPPKWIPM